MGALMSDDTLETERLILVRPTMQHLAAYTAFCASDRARFVGGPFDAAKAYEKLCAMAGHWNLRGFGRYVITHRQTGEALGHVGALQIDDIDPPGNDLDLVARRGSGEGICVRSGTGVSGASRARHGR